MKLGLFTTVSILAAYSEAAKIGQVQAQGETFLERISSLELSQAEAATMTDAEIESRAEVIADLFLENAVESEVSAEARAEIVGSIGGALKSGVTMLASTIIPGLIAIIGMKLISPWLC